MTTGEDGVECKLCKRLKMCEKTVCCNYLSMITDSIRSSGCSFRCENWCRGGRLRKGGWRWLVPGGAVAVVVCSHLSLGFY
jgi:hypothetical protein